MAPLCSDDSIKALVILPLLETLGTEAKLERVCMESLEHKSVSISLPNCNTMLIFGKWAFSVMVFPNILSNLIISQISVFETSHFSSLFPLYIIPADYTPFKGRCLAEMSKFCLPYSKLLQLYWIKRFYRKKTEAVVWR